MSMVGDGLVVGLQGYLNGLPTLIYILLYIIIILYPSSLFPPKLKNTEVLPLVKQVQYQWES